MQIPSLSHVLARIHRLRQMIGGERRRPTSSSIRLLRLQRLLLQAQDKLAARLFGARTAVDSVVVRTTNARPTPVH